MGLTVSSSLEATAIVSGLSVTYRPAGSQLVRALDQATLTIWPGERVGILGESGSGKSTLAAAFLRLLPPDARYESGSIHFNGRDVLTLPESELRHIRGAEIALIPQDPALVLNPVLSVGDQIGEVLRAHSRMNVRERAGRV